MKKIFTCIIVSLIISAMPIAIFAENVSDNDVNLQISQSENNETYVDSNDQSFHKEFLDKEFERNKWLMGLTDVSNDDWFAPILPGVYDIMKGVTETEFAPNQPMTRAMFATVLYRLSGESVVGSAVIFQDVPLGAWYKDAVNWAAENNIVNGVGERMFEPNSNITREQIAVMLKKFSEYKQYNLVIRDTNLAEYSTFLDVNSVSAWAEDSMKWAVQYGIIKGSNIGLEPQKNATRAEVAQLMYNFIMSK